MPFRSQAQWKWAFATNQDFARQWARETPGGKRKFTRLSKKLGMKAAMDEYMTSYKAEREFVRDASGKFAEKPGGGIDKVEQAKKRVEGFAKPKKGGGGKAPKKTAAQRSAERATEARDNAMTTLDKVGFDAGDYELLNTDAAQDASDPSVQRLLDKGLMEKVGDKIYVSSLGKQVTSAAEAGDADKAQQTLDRAAAKRAEREARQQERDDKRAEAEAKREAKRQEAEEKKKRGGGGGGKADAAKKKREAVARTKRITQLEQRLERETDGDAAIALRDEIEKLRSTKTTKADGHSPPDGVRQAAKRGLELRSQFGRGGTAVGIARARDLSNGTRVSDSTIKRMASFFARHAVDKRPGWGDPANPTNGYIAHLLWGGDAGKAWANKIARQLDAMTVKENIPTNPDLWKRAIAAAKRRYSVYPSRYANAFASTWYRSRGGKWRVKSATTKSASASAPAQMTVYKSKDGYRWVAISSTAYRDRDKEIVSTKALKGALEKAQASGEYGPLRFWHVPGLDIGTTDYQALSDDGKYLVESGIVTNDAVAEALMQKGKGWQVSIGFEHPKTEPDGDGVFENIRIFERSITPPGRAANPMTGFDMVGDEVTATKSVSYKHGKHDQKSHGRKTARRAAYQAAYSAAKAEGKSVTEARDAAKSASRVELEKRVAERRAEVAQRAAERAAKRAQGQVGQYSTLEQIQSATDENGDLIFRTNLRQGRKVIDTGSGIEEIDIKARTDSVRAPDEAWSLGPINSSNQPMRIAIGPDGTAYLANQSTVIPISDTPIYYGKNHMSLNTAQANAVINRFNRDTGLNLRLGMPELKGYYGSDAQRIMKNGGSIWSDSSGTRKRLYINDPRIPSSGKLFYDVVGKKWSADGVPDDVASTLIAQYSQ
jgi:hypothetical protein